MTCLTSAEEAVIEAKIEKLNALIDAAEIALLASVTNSEIEEYRLDTGDGSQKAIRRDPNAIEKLIQSLTSRRDRLIRELAGTLNVVMKFRRNRGGCARY